jgi:RimJ/RimL family protein N-acetyltransferase/catechol 2,3-dioxygenase-like lactoylglutathione lyase family enzyme
VSLEGRTVRLEPIGREHAEAMWQTLCGPGDAALWTYRPQEMPAERAASDALVRALAEADDTVTFATVPADGVARGHATLMRVDAENGSVEVGGIIYARSLQRTVAATEAMVLLMRHVFNDLGYRRYEWKLDDHNAPSAAAARRLGFVYEGRFRHAIVYKGPQPRHRLVRHDRRRLRPPAIGVRSLARPRKLRPGRPSARLAFLAHRRGRSACARVSNMDQRVSFITLAVRDVAASRTFYVDGLGWEAALHEPGEVLMFKVADKVVLSLWDAGTFEAEIGAAPAWGGVPPVTLAHNVSTKEGVDRVLETARRAGAEPVGEAQEREWGGYTGYFADPDGFRWEVAYNPGPIGQDVLP